MNFIHMADMHLGYKQYDLEQRFLDLGHTFKEIASYAIANRVDFVLISGDLFDKRSINAPTYIQAVHVLSMLREAGIPCIAIEGNHDRRFMKDGMSWLESLEWEGLLKVIKNYDGNLMGSYIDVGRTRIFGLGFAGSLTSAAIPQIAREIAEINAKAPPEKTILMMHAGVQGQMKYGIIGEVTYEDLCPLREVIDYLALGHYHSNYEIDDWVYNPGCPDTCSIAELGEPKGIYHVTDSGAKLVPQDIRKFITLPIVADAHKSVESLLSDLRERLSGSGNYREPIVNVIITGTLNFDRSHLNVDAIEELVKERTGALYAEVRFNLLNDDFAISMLESESLDRAGIEREVFRKLARSDSILASSSDVFATALSEVKDLAIKGADERTLDVVLRRIYKEVKSAPQTVIEIPPHPEAQSTAANPEPEITPAPVKKPRKKTQKAGQLSLDLGDGA